MDKKNVRFETADGEEFKFDKIVLTEDEYKDFILKLSFDILPNLITEYPKETK